MLKIKRKKLNYNNVLVTKIRQARQTRTKQGFKGLSIFPCQAKVELEILFDLLQSHI